MFVLNKEKILLSSKELILVMRLKKNKKYTKSTNKNQYIFQHKKNTIDKKFYTVSFYSIQLNMTLILCKYTSELYTSIFSRICGKFTKHQFKTFKKYYITFYDTAKIYTSCVPVFIRSLFVHFIVTFCYSVLIFLQYMVRIWEKNHVKPIL